MPKFKKKLFNRSPNLFQEIISFYLNGIQDKNEIEELRGGIQGTSHKKFRRFIRLWPVDPDEIDFVFHGASAEIAEKGHFRMETYY